MAYPQRRVPLKLESKEKLFDVIHDRCRECVLRSSDVRINDDKIEEFVDKLVLKNVEDVSGQGLPLKFVDLEAEISTYCTIDLLEFGSGYRSLLHEHCKQGAHNTILFGVMGMYISEPKGLDADCFLQMSLMKIHSYFKIPIDVEKEIQPAIYATESHPLRAFADKIRRVMNETGEILLARQCSSLGDFILKTLKGKTPNKESKWTAEALVLELAKAFPSLDDRVEWNSEDGKDPKQIEVIFMKKAQLMVSNLYRRYKDKNEIFNFPDIEEMTIFADNVIPAVLRQEGILEIEGKTMEKIINKSNLSIKNKDVPLRAGCIEACNRIVRKVKEAKGVDIVPVKLDYYLWKLGKEEGYRNVIRHEARDTVFY